MVKILESIIMWQEAHPAILQAIGVVLYSLAIVGGILGLGFLALVAISDLCAPRAKGVTADNE